MANTARPAAPGAESAALKGHFNRQVAGAESVEIKATIAADHIRQGLKRLGLDRNKAEQRFIYFFDTPKLALLKSGVIVRARRVPGNWHDTTIKIRPVNANQVPAKWKKHKGFKLEADAGETDIVRSASLSRNIEKGLIKRVAGGEADLPAIFDKSQELFLAEMCRIRYDLRKLEMLGPIEALWWKVSHRGLPMPMTAELWKRSDGELILEVSVRVSVEQAAFSSAGFLAFLAEFGATRDNAQQAKTRWAASFFAEQLQTAASRQERALPKKPAKKQPLRAGRTTKSSQSHPVPASRDAKKQQDRKTPSRRQPEPVAAELAVADPSDASAADRRTST